MVIRTLREYNRRDPNLRKSEVLDALPSYFADEYPNIVEFLKEYYEGLHDQEIMNTLEYDLFALRDLDEVNLNYIDRIFYEIGNGASSQYFSKPRFIGKLLSFLIKNKGNELSAQLFFRTFFGETADILYPKDNIFIVNESPLNDFRYVIQDGRRYQILSILIRSAIPIAEWESLYRSFVHTAGYFLSADVILEVIADNSLDGNMPLSVPVDPSASYISLVDNSGITSAESEIYLLSDSATTVYVSSPLDTIDKYSSTPISNINAQYEDLRELTQASSPTMDEDSDGVFKSVTMSNEFEYMDQDKVLKSYIDSA